MPDDIEKQDPELGQLGTRGCVLPPLNRGGAFLLLLCGVGVYSWLLVIFVYNYFLDEFFF